MNNSLYISTKYYALNKEIYKFCEIEKYLYKQIKTLKSKIGEILNDFYQYEEIALRQINCKFEFDLKIITFV